MTKQEKFKNTTYGQKMITMVDEVAREKFNLVHNLDVEKDNDSITVSFLYQDDEGLHAFNWDMMEYSKTKKLRDLKRALIKKLNEIE